VQAIVRAIASLNLLLTGRLHGALTAYQLGVPFILDEYHVKCADFLDDIGQVDALRVPADVFSSDAIPLLSMSAVPADLVPGTAPSAYAAVATAALVSVLDAAQIAV
jgi:hypothetical protein